MSITSSLFGYLDDGTKVTAYTMSSECGISATILDLGGILHSVLMPDRHGNISDIVCGYDTPQQYLENDGYVGALIGRYANRIKNGRFVLNGITYNVTKNENGKNSLHGGNVGFDKKLWQVKQGVCKCGADKLTLTCVSEDGEEGFPGKLYVKVVYRLTSDGELSIRYFAITDKDTPISMTNHAYFNLAGYDKQNILDHYLQVNADEFVKVDSDLIPTTLCKTAETAFDFSSPKKIAADIFSDDEQLKIAGGYDHSFVISDKKRIDWRYGLTLTEAAVLYDENSGRKFSLYTDAPGLQIYSANFIEGNIFKNNVKAKKHGSVCLETGFFPDSPNRPDFPTCIYCADRDYECTAVFKLEIIK